MKVLATMVGFALGLSGCVGKYEQLAKCSGDDSTVLALGYGPEPHPPAPAFDAVLPHDCGPMRSVNQF